MAPEAFLHLNRFWSSSLIVPEAFIAFEKKKKILACAILVILIRKKQLVLCSSDWSLFQHIVQIFLSFSVKPQATTSPHLTWASPQTPACAAWTHTSAREHEENTLLATGHIHRMIHIRNINIPKELEVTPSYWPMASIAIQRYFLAAFTCIPSCTYKPTELLPFKKEKKKKG